MLLNATLLAQYYIVLPPRMALHFVWSRCVNTTGKPGVNVPCDLHMERLRLENGMDITSCIDEKSDSIGSLHSTE